MPETGHKAKSDYKDKSGQTLSKKKQRLFKFGAVLLVFLFIVMVEVILRVVGYGTGYPLFVEVQGQPENIVINKNVAEKYFFFTDNATSGYQEPFSKIKDPETYRIFVLGASTGVGYPYQTNGSFHRWLQFGLNETFPDKTIEVINLSMTAVNSYTLLDFTDQMIAQNPDAVLIYAGHNEFYGALGVGASNALGQSTTFVNFMLDAREFRLVQLIAHGISKIKKAIASTPSNRETLMQKMVESQYISLDSKKFKAGINQFENNMADLLEKLNNSNVPTFISTLVSNERGIRPFESDTTKTDLNAEYQFELGEEAYLKEDFETAKKQFIRAKELDQLRFRAPLAMNEIIVKQSENLQNIHLVNSRKAFEEESPNRIIGNDLLTEHVHPNLRGYSLLGYNFYTALQEHQQIQKDWPKSLSRNDFLNRMPITEVDSIAGFYEVMMLKEGWPYYEPIDKTKINATTPPERLGGKVAVKQVTWDAAMQELYSYYIQQQRKGEALKVLQGLLLEQPKHKEILFEAGSLALDMDSISRAARFFNKLSLIDKSSNILKGISKKMIDAGAIEGALPYLEDIIQKNPDDTQTAAVLSTIQAILKIEADRNLNTSTAVQLKLANYYIVLGQYKTSKLYIQAVLENEPSNAEALKLLEKTRNF